MNRYAANHASRLSSPYPGLVWKTGVVLAGVIFALCAYVVLFDFALRLHLGRSAPGAFLGSTERALFSEELSQAQALLLFVWLTGLAPAAFFGSAWFTRAVYKNTNATVSRVVGGLGYLGVAASVGCLMWLITWFWASWFGTS